MVQGQLPCLLGQVLKLQALRSPFACTGFLSIAPARSILHLPERLFATRNHALVSTALIVRKQHTAVVDTSDPTPSVTPTPPRPFTVPNEGPASIYWQRRNEGLYRGDPRQERTIELLQGLYTTLKSVLQPTNKPSGLTLVDNVGVTKKKDSWWAGLGALLPSPQSRAQVPITSVKGLYMFGGVGCGKTMLMDVLVETCPPEFKVQRTHFHDFMLSVHMQLREHKGEADPLVRVADSIARSTRVLALDEFFVTDIADAMILHRLFSHLWQFNLVLVATSNRHPDKLYEGGLQRPLFLPFIERLKKECFIHDMASTTDYRRLARHQQGLYFVTPSRGELLYEAFLEMAQGQRVGETAIDVAMGRHMVVPLAAGPLCMFGFNELCERAVGASDYSALTRAFHTIALSGVPVFNAANRPSAYRFVTLVDIMYEHRTCLLCAADALPHELFENIMTQEEARKANAFNRPDIVVDDNLGFAKDRTISRLTEMQSTEYLLAHARQNAPELLLALQEAKG